MSYPKEERKVEMIGILVCTRCGKLGGTLEKHGDRYVHAVCPADEPKMRLLPRMRYSRALRLQKEMLEREGGRTLEEQTWGPASVVSHV